MSLDAADIAEFFDEDMPGYALATVAGVSVPGLFRSQYAEMLGISGTRPAFLCAESDLESAAPGDAVTIDGIAYTIASIQAEGAFQARLMLQEA